ncbi:transporter substrate-binding domain-containing protein [Alteromonas sp. KUL49]|uniref:substrate-binding periplasmic protein n=1 Tax=Alteromonas sp. KUL49 TaxID=2480798 RepID=UPI00102F08E3|nr:transporter substrate-binding domain-containing protein [Alteromonas sp. KUL49]TAP40203.1 transporter substrate-binding domain-containing protein [Alteromonas sp. KUL49]GEA11332.1 hypothetical protein KUL49_17070 [Alteromonas sp. KUL49]
MVNKSIFVSTVLAFTAVNAFANDACDEIRISAHPNYPPFHWEEDGTLTGASIETSVNIFESLDLRVNILFVGPWKRVLSNARHGAIDFIPALKKSPERETYLVFSEEAFSYNPVSVFVRRGEFQNIQSLEELAGNYGSINAGDKHGEPVDGFVGEQPEVQNIHGIVGNFMMLRQHRIDYFITGNLVGRDYIQAHNLEDEVDIALTVDRLEIHNAFTQEFAFKCPHIVASFDEKLRELKSEGKIGQSIVRHNNRWLAQFSID